jgi:hypothetical protein
MNPSTSKKGNPKKKGVRRTIRNTATTRVHHGQQNQTRIKDVVIQQPEFNNRKLSEFVYKLFSLNFPRENFTLRLRFIRLLRNTLLIL